MDNYYKVYLDRLQHELLFRFRDSTGKDISDIIRGKIIMLVQVMGLKDVIQNYEKLKKDLQEQKDKLNKPQGAR